MKRHYETVIIFTPILTEQEVKQSARKYIDDVLVKADSTIVNEDLWGLRQLAYPIKKKTTGFYLIVEHQSTADAVKQMEVLFRRDTNVLRFLTVKLDKWGVEYTDNKRKGLIGKKKDATTEVDSQTQNQEG